MSDLHRELLVQQLQGALEVGGERCEHQFRAEALAIQFGGSVAARRDRWLHAGEGRKLFEVDGLLPV